MAVPIIENIAANIAASVNLITTENGFQQDLTAVRPKRFDLRDVAPEDGVVLVTQQDESPSGAEAYPTTEIEQTFNLVAFVVDSDDASTSVDTRINQVVADIRKKLREDPQRNSNAIDTTFGSVWFIDDEDFTGVVVPVIVRYRTQRNDPYTMA